MSVIDDWFKHNFIAIQQYSSGLWRQATDLNTLKMLRGIAYARTVQLGPQQVRTHNDPPFALPEEILAWLPIHERLVIGADNAATGWPPSYSSRFILEDLTSLPPWAYSLDLNFVKICSWKGLSAFKKLSQLSTRNCSITQTAGVLSLHKIESLYIDNYTQRSPPSLAAAIRCLLNARQTDADVAELVEALSEHDAGEYARFS